ncbi:MAG: hypothetical protein PQJ46_01900 [Spirochaetales bacterium]|nr:hypothetical protein [Spirochaetales bacterium]
MKSQLDAYNALNSDKTKDSLLSEYNEEESYTLGYVDVKDTSGNDKPFLPGYYLPNKENYYNSTYKREMTAGVDDMGLLLGSMAMMDAGSFYNTEDKDICENLDTFFAMKKKDTMGLDSNREPVFNSTSTNSYDNILSMTMADIERGSIIVPDVSDMRQGDLLVRNTEEGHNVGIVVGFKNNQVPKKATAASSFWTNVLVVSVRPGFQAVTLGTWGNSGNIFGGFTENPEEYVIRRLVKHEELAITKVMPEDNECVKPVYFQYPYDYPEHEAYWNGKNTTASGSKDRFQMFVKTDGAVLEELPPSSYRGNIIHQPMFKRNGTVEEHMAISSYSGWREMYNTRITYHRGVDFVPVINNSSHATDIGGETPDHILAPEDGKYWILDLKYDSDNEAQSLFIKIDDDNILILESYSSRTHGDLGILVTNPEDPQKGRIYVIAHLFFNNTASVDTNTNEKSNISVNSNVEGCSEHFEGSDSIHFVDKDGNEMTTLPESCDNAGYVKTGDWIGLMGGNPSYPPHVHAEVYEYFKNFEKDESNFYGSTYEKINKNLGTNYTYEDILEFSKWQRINARHIYPESMLEPRSYANGPQILLNTLEEKTDSWWTEEGVDKSTFIDALFKDWTLWDLPEEK